MKYAVVKVVNGNFSVHAELGNLNEAKVSYHSLCQTLWNAPDVLTGQVMVVDENLHTPDGYTEHIVHESKAVSVDNGAEVI